MKRLFAYRSFMPEYETMKRFRSIGVNTFTLMLSNGVTSSGDPYTAFEPIWLAEDKYDFDMIDREVQGVINAVPDARFIFYIDLNPPAWWYRRHYWRCDPFHQLGRLAADEEWRSETAEYFKVILKYLEEKYGERVEAYLYTGGGTTEWFDYSDGEDSISRGPAYKKWCAAKGFPVPQDVPGRSVRDACPRGFLELYAHVNYKAPSKWQTAASLMRFDGNGMFRTPADNPEAVRYWQFCNEQISDVAVYFAQVAREVIRKEIPLGTTFGNTLDAPPSVRVQADFMRVFDAPEIDFIVGPASYIERGMGGGTGSQITDETLRVRGKMSLVSSDHRSYTCRNLRPYDRWVTMWKNNEEVIAGVRREFSCHFIDGRCTWWFDMMGGWWDSDAAMKTIKRGVEIWKQYAEEQPDLVRETLVLYQPENTILLNKYYAGSGGSHCAIHSVCNHAARTIGYGVLSDLAKMDTSKVRCFVLPNAFRFSEEEEKLLKEKVFLPGNRVIWFYAPGVITADGHWDEAQVEKRCGVKYGTPGVQEKLMPGSWTSIYIQDYHDFTKELFNKILDEAGTHAWCDKPRPIFANGHFAAFHTGEAETLHFSFPGVCSEIEDLFTGEKWQNIQTLEFTTNGPETRLFRYEVK